MPKYDVQLINMEKTVIFGREMQSGNRTQAEDIRMLSSSFYEQAGFAPGDDFPYYIVNAECDRRKHKFILFVGGLKDAPALQAHVLPEGVWATIEIRPRFKKLWAGVIESTKRWFYQSWLPKSGYVAMDVEYEYYTEDSISEEPKATIYFFIRKKEGVELL